VASVGGNSADTFLSAVCVIAAIDFWLNSSAKNPAAKAGFCFVVRENSRSRKRPNQYLATTGAGANGVNL
jgi:hypothetical protein